MLTRHPAGISLPIERATDADAAGIAAVRLAASRELTARFGHGTWSFALDSEGGVRAELRSSTILVARDAAQVVGTLRLATRTPWLGDTGFFTPVAHPLFLTSMAITPTHQRQGIGRQMLEIARREAYDRRAGAIRLDAYDAPAGAGEFYRRCGFREVHRGDYHGTPLIWFETLLGADALSDRH